VIRVKKQPKIFKIYLLVSILLIALMPMYLEFLTGMYPEAYPPGDALPNSKTTEVAGKIAIYVWPLLLGYIIFTIIMLRKKTNNRKSIYPLSLGIISYILFFLAALYYTFILAIIWFYILIIPLIIIMIILLIIGWKIDNKKKKKET
jgi:hypothetical protein